MTEKEAIKIINEEKSWESDNRKIDAFIIAIDSLEEVQKYRELEKKLNGVDLVMLANHWMEMAAEGEVKGYQRGRVLTNEDADQWDAYKEIGTPEECREALEKQQTMDWDAKYDECVCPKCGTLNTTWEKRANTVKHDKVYCWHCGQSVEFRLE